MATKPQKDRTARGTTARIGEARLVRLRLQNEKLNNEVRRLKGEVAPVEQIKAEVIRANMTVKVQFLSLGPRLSPALASMSDSHEISRMLTREIEQICNDLAYSKEVPPQSCPTCGAKLSGGTKEEAQ
jgi:hypothetical protein